MNKRKISCAVMVILLLTIFSVKGEAAISYGAVNSLDTSTWAIEDVEAAEFYGIVPSELLEMPLTESITREEFASLIVSVWEEETNIKMKVPEDNPFVDCDCVNVLKAFELGIVNGLGNGAYAPKDTLTREAAATMLTR